MEEQAGYMLSKKELQAFQQLEVDEGILKRYLHRVMEAGQKMEEDLFYKVGGFWKKFGESHGLDMGHRQYHIMKEGGQYFVVDDTTMENPTTRATPQPDNPYCTWIDPSYVVKS